MELKISRVQSHRILIYTILNILCRPTCKLEEQISRDM